jgi:DUF1009 family protein
MGRGIGIVAGSGRFVAEAVSELRRSGLRCVVLGIEGESRPGLKNAADAFSSFKTGELGRALAFFKDQQVSEIILLGKVRPDAVFRRENFDAETWRRLEKIKTKSAPTILETAFAFLKSQGFKVLSPGPLLSRYFCGPGVLTRSSPSPAVMKDIDFGLRIARKAADLEIGQTLVVKGGAVVAVEAMEGTDRTIQRGGRLAGPGFVVVKAGRTSQDMKVDLPAVGLDTMKILLRAGGSALGLEAGKVAFFQKQAAVRLADAQGASVVVRSMD